MSDTRQLIFRILAVAMVVDFAFLGIVFPIDRPFAFQLMDSLGMIAIAGF
jgi:hypothetical protein